MKIYYDTVREPNGEMTGRMKGQDLNLKDLIAFAPFIGKAFSVAVNREGRENYSNADILAYLNTTFVSATQHLMNELGIEEFTDQEKLQADILSREMLEDLTQREFDLTPWE